MSVITQSLQAHSMPHYASIALWKDFLKANRWQDLIKGVQPIMGGCGLVYDLPELHKIGESFAIVDMSNIAYSEPHYHSAHVTEIYIVLEGYGVMVIGNQEYSFKQEDVFVTSPLTTHYVIPNKSCVLAVINTPEFAVQDYHVITETNATVKFDKNQFNRLIKSK